MTFLSPLKIKSACCAELRGLYSETSPTVENDRESGSGHGNGVGLKNHSERADLDGAAIQFR
jgi:hypothetical protein